MARRDRNDFFSFLMYFYACAYERSLARYANEWYNRIAYLNVIKWGRKMRLFYQFIFLSGKDEPINTML